MPAATSRRDCALGRNIAATTRTFFRSWLTSIPSARRDRASVLPIFRPRLTPAIPCWCFCKTTTSSTAPSAACPRRTRASTACWSMATRRTKAWARTFIAAPPGVDGGLSVRGVIGYRPLPTMRSVSYDGTDVTVHWDGPASHLFDALAGTTTAVHRYQLERSLSLTPPDFQPV